MDVKPDYKQTDAGVIPENWKSHNIEREALKYLCEPVLQPREVEQYIHYFCGDASNPNVLNKTEPLRIAFYKAVAAFIRAFTAISQEWHNRSTGAQCTFSVTQS